MNQKTMERAGGGLPEVNPLKVARSQRWGSLPRPLYRSTAASLLTGLAQLALPIFRSYDPVVRYSGMLSSQQ